MLKGKTVIELTDVRTGIKEVHENTNMVTKALMDILNTNIQGMLYNNTNFNGSEGDSWMLPLKKNLLGGILLYQNPLEERVDNIYAPLDNPLIGYASDDANNAEDIRRGSRNLTESMEVDGGFKFVWDFATSQANGTISAICLSNTLAGKGTQYAGNYMVQIGRSASDVTGIYKDYLYRDNKRVYLEAGYRLEMTTSYNSTQAVLRKVKDDYLHARLLNRPLSDYVTKSQEETIIEIGHYPQHYYYTGGSKDGTEEAMSSSTAPKSYLYHGFDGKWYGIVKRDNRKYSYTSNGREYYDHISYEWFMVTVDGTRVTSQKIVTPSQITDFDSIGMSGKWLMCYTGSSVYRIDTTNVANIVQVPNISYVPSSAWTYIIDDDIVINGWYFLDGEPKLYIRDTADESNAAWGRSQITRYKTYAIRQWLRYSYSDYYFYKELYLYTPYLATINNLATPVIKTPDKTMKITYKVIET